MKISMRAVSVIAAMGVLTLNESAGAKAQTTSEAPNRLVAAAKGSDNALIAQSSEERMAALIKWVVTEGKPAAIRGNIAELLELGNGKTDLPATGKAFRDKDSRLHLFQVWSQNQTLHLVISCDVEKERCKMIWRISNEGEVVATVRTEVINDTIVPFRKVSNQQYGEVLAAELKYWDARLTARLEAK